MNIEKFIRDSRGQTSHTQTHTGDVMNQVSGPESAQDDSLSPDGPTAYLQ